jgi:S-adenosylmethionine uptake transporter
LVFFGGAGNLALTRSFGSGSTWLSAALQYCTILVSTFYGIVVLGDVPTSTTWVGVLLIIACGGLSSYATHKRRLTDA